MSQEFKDVYGVVEENEKKFLIEFLFQLTILGRQIHHELSGQDLSEASKQLNEISHRILNRIKDLDKVDPWCTKEYLLEMVPHHVKLAPQLAIGVTHAANKARANVNA